MKVRDVQEIIEELGSEYYSKYLICKEIHGNPVKAEKHYVSYEAITELLWRVAHVEKDMLFHNIKFNIEQEGKYRYMKELEKENVDKPSV